MHSTTTMKTMTWVICDSEKAVVCKLVDGQIQYKVIKRKVKTTLLAERYIRSNLITDLSMEPKNDDD